MERPNYQLDENPIYTEEIPALLNSDPASAEEVFNPLLLKLLNNQKALKLLSDALSTAKAEKEHSHSKAEITDFPSSLPANGGNADTVGGVPINHLFRFYFADAIDIPDGTDLQEYFHLHNQKQIGGLYRVNSGNHVTHSFADDSTDWKFFLYLGNLLFGFDISGNLYYLISMNYQFLKWIKLEETPASLPANGGNADTVGGLSADNFKGHPSYNYQGINGGNANDYTHEAHLFVFNMANTPPGDSWGFLDVSHFFGAGFIPSDTGVTLQKFTSYHLNRCAYRIMNKSGWSEWVSHEINGNADTTDGLHFEIAAAQPSTVVNKRVSFVYE